MRAGPHVAVAAVAGALLGVLLAVWAQGSDPSAFSFQSVILLAAICATAGGIFVAIAQKNDWFAVFCLWPMYVGATLAGVVSLVLSTRASSLGDAAFFFVLGTVGGAAIAGTAGIALGLVLWHPIHAVRRAEQSRRLGGIHVAKLVSAGWLVAIAIAVVFLAPRTQHAFAVCLLASLSGVAFAVAVAFDGWMGLRATKAFVERVRAGREHDLRIAPDGLAIDRAVGFSLDYRGEQRAWETVALLP